jgi:hypothetical protein
VAEEPFKQVLVMVILLALQVAVEMEQELKLIQLLEHQGQAAL